MQAHKVEVVLSENGTLVLKDLPLQAGATLEVIILERSAPQPISNATSDFSLQGTVLFYDKPFEPAVLPEEWEALQ